MSLKIKLAIIFLAISIIPVGVISLLSFHYAKKALEETTIDGLNTIAEFKEGELLLYLEQLKISTRDFSSDGFIQERVEDIARYEVSKVSLSASLSDHLKRNKLPLNDDLVLIDVLNLDGVVIASSMPARVGINESTQAYFEKGKNRVYMYDINKEDGHQLDIKVSAPLVTRSEPSSTIGVIVNHFNVDKLNDLFSGDLVLGLGAKSQKRGIGKTGETYLVNQDKFMLTQSLFYNNKAMELKVETYPVQNGLEQGVEVNGLWSDYRGVPVVGSSMVITHDDFRWVLVTEQDQAEAFKPIHNLKQVSFYIVLLTLCGVLLITVISIMKICGPISKLTKSLDEITRGNMLIEIENVNGRDEISFMSRAFNKMMFTLRNTMDKLETKNQQLQDMSAHDGLTGIYNRRHLETLARFELEIACRYGVPLSCMMIDVDHFKSVNDKYGHPFGDFVLCQIVKIINKVLRSTDIVGRYGGEEILVMLTYTGLDDAKVVAEKILCAIANHPFVDKEHSYSASVSIGVAAFGDNIHNLNELICCSDQALYQAKNSGRNRACSWPDLDTKRSLIQMPQSPG